MFKSTNALSFQYIVKMWMDLKSNPSFLHQVFQNNDETLIYKMNSFVGLETPILLKDTLSEKCL